MIRVVATALLGFALASCGVETVTPSASTPSAIIPECPPNAGCGEGFVIGETVYFYPCVRLRADAVSPAPYAEAPAPLLRISQVRTLPADLFLAVRGPISCDDADQNAWWLAQADEMSPAELGAHRGALDEVIQR